MQHATGRVPFREGGTGRPRRRAPRRAIFGVSLLVGLALVAAACGSDDSSNKSAAESTTTSGGSGATSTTASGGSTATTAAAAQPTTLDGWEALWTKERDAVVKRITDNQWGKSADGTKVTGPEGFTIDLTKCPSGWSDTEGLTDDSIKVGFAIAASGPLAEYNNYTIGIRSVFDYYNGQGGFADVNGKTRKINFLAKDDGYDPARTIPIVDEYLDSDKVFAVWTSGSPSTLKTYDKINQRCVAHPMAVTGHPAWGDPVNHPWTTGAPALVYSTEAILWATFLGQHASEFPADQKIKVAALVINNDFGKIYDASFKAAVAQSPELKDRVDYKTDTLEPSAPTITDQMTTLAADKPDMFIAMTAGTSCTQAVTEAAQNGMKETTKYLFQPATCAGTAFVKKEKVGGDGSAANDWWIMNPGAKDLTDKAFADDVYVKWAREQVQAQGSNPDTSSLFSAGIILGWSFVQFLDVAGQLPGGLNRTNFTIAQRAIDMTNPMYLAGVKFHMNGNKDAYFVEAGGWQQWDAASQTWILKSPIADLDGKSANCPWSTSTSTCG
jgi:ABC-type branched-subunit amino acid transport system substrate-binding protein